MNVTRRRLKNPFSWRPDCLMLENTGNVMSARWPHGRDTTFLTLKYVRYLQCCATDTWQKDDGLLKFWNGKFQNLLHHRVFTDELCWTEDVVDLLSVRNYNRSESSLKHPIKISTVSKIQWGQLNKCILHDFRQRFGHNVHQDGQGHRLVSFFHNKVVIKSHISVAAIWTRWNSSTESLRITQRDLKPLHE